MLVFLSIELQTASYDKLSYCVYESNLQVGILQSRFCAVQNTL